MPIDLCMYLLWVWTKVYTGTSNIFNGNYIHAAIVEDATVMQVYGDDCKGIYVAFSPMSTKAILVETSITNLISIWACSR